MPKAKNARECIRINHVAYALLMKRMMGVPASVADLCEATGLNNRTVWNITRVLRRHRVVHIAKWGQDSIGRWQIAYYCVGSLPDKPKPVRSPEEIQEMLRASARKRYAKKKASTPTPEAVAAANMFRV